MNSQFVFSKTKRGLSEDEQSLVNKMFLRCFIRRIKLNLLFVYYMSIVCFYHVKRLENLLKRCAYEMYE